MLLQGRMICSVEWPNSPEDRYYWLHGFWVDSDDWDSNIQMFLGVLADFKLLYTSQVDFHSVRFYIPHTETVHYEQGISAGNHGSLSPQTNYTILVASRWRMYGDDGSYTYHLHRQPIGEAYLENGGWTATGLLQQQSRVNTYIAQMVYRTPSGALIASGKAANRPVMWQMRHGTKRRTQQFWL